MKYSEIENQKTRFIEILHNKFQVTYPDTFVKCRTLDKEVYENANGAMYSWYGKLANINMLRLSPKYSQTKEEVTNNDHSCVKRFVDDFESSTNWQSFLIENVLI